VRCQVLMPLYPFAPHPWYASIEYSILYFYTFAPTTIHNRYYLSARIAANYWYGHVHKPIRDIQDYTSCSFYSSWIVQSEASHSNVQICDKSGHHSKIYHTAFESYDVRVLILFLFQVITTTSSALYTPRGRKYMVFLLPTMSNALFCQIL
jgi:hypothetical protein